MSLHLLRNAMIVCMIGSFAMADEATDKAKAALALAKAQRERTTPTTSKAMPKAAVMEGCFDDLATARMVSKKLRKPLVLWVGMTCKDANDVCEAIRDDVVSCHLTSYHGSPTARVIVTDYEGVEYRVLKSEIDATTPIGLRKRMGLPIASVVECTDGRCNLRQP